MDYSSDDDETYIGSDVDFAGDDSDVSVDGGDDGGGGDVIADFSDGSDSIVVSSDKPYTVLKDSDIRRLMDDDISNVSSVLSVSIFEASALLRWFNWSVSKVHDEWFADEAKVRKAVGFISSGKRIERSSEFSQVCCGICFDNFDSNCDSVLDSGCGHVFCVDCWQGYISNSINDGSGCLNLRCPEPSCSVAVDHGMIDRLVCDDDKKKYYGFLFRSYVEENRRIKWCPAPGCDFAVEFEIGSDSFDVMCGCSNFFCWNCTEEAHRPVDCEAVAKWTKKNSEESENTNWILAYTKPCPKCKKPIEKNDGCMRMTCRDPCNYQFCWLCLNSWSVHGYKPCNRYKQVDEADKKKEMAKQSIEKYIHYYERWDANDKSMKKAIGDLHRMEEVTVKELSVVQTIPVTQLKFVVEAWKQIIECRRVLKWTYAYGFFLADEEHTKRQFFEYLQGQAEAGLERLHHCAEKELEIFLNVEEGNSKTFVDFRIKLTGLISVTRNYFENLVTALVNGLEDVDCQEARGKMPSGNGCQDKGRKSLSDNTSGAVKRLRMRAKNAGFARSNNTRSLKDVLAGGSNIKTSTNLMIRGDNNITTQRKFLEALGNNTPGLQNLQPGGSYTTAQRGDNNITTQRKLLAAMGNYTPGLQNLQPGGSYTTAQRGDNNITTQRKFLAAMDNNTPGLQNLQPGGSYTTAQRGDNDITTQRNLLAAMGNKTPGLQNLQPGESYTTAQRGDNNITTQRNLLAAMGNNTPGLQNVQPGGSYTTAPNFSPHPEWSDSTGTNNVKPAGDNNVWGSDIALRNRMMSMERTKVMSLTNAPLVAGSHKFPISRSVDVAGSSNGIRIGKRQRTATGTHVVINLDDDHSGENTSATGVPVWGNDLGPWALHNDDSGAPVIQNLVDGLGGGWVCERCTFFNTISTQTCIMCNQDASGSWVCEKCTFVNEKNVAKCQICEHQGPRK